MKIGILVPNRESAGQHFAAINPLNPASVLDPVRHIKAAMKAGFRNFEITYDIATVFPGIFDGRKIEELRQLKANHNLTYSVHLPLRVVELACPHPILRNAAIALTIEAIKTMSPLEPEVYVLHATGALAIEALGMDLPFLFDKFVAGHLLKFSALAIKEILAETGLPSRRLAVESVEFPFAMMDDMIAKLDLSICMDVGHIVAGYSGKTDVPRFVDRYFDRITEVHLHDAYRRVQGTRTEAADHLPLGEGTLDYVWLFNNLLSRGYEGRVVLEMDVKQAQSSLAALKQHFMVDLTLNILQNAPRTDTSPEGF